VLVQLRYALVVVNVAIWESPIDAMRIFGARLSTIGEMAFGIVLCVWGWIEGDAMSVAIGFPFFLSAAYHRKFERLEQQIAELRDQRSEAR
jgi:hypothetical protein